MSLLHFVTQNGQPYMSTRKCCSVCGVMTYGTDKRVTDEWANYILDPDRCDIVHVDPDL